MLCAGTEHTGWAGATRIFEPDYLMFTRASVVDVDVLPVISSVLARPNASSDPGAGLNAEWESGSALGSRLGLESALGSRLGLESVLGSRLGLGSA